jgi:hypothetical protein
LSQDLNIDRASQGYIRSFTDKYSIVSTLSKIIFYKDLLRMNYIVSKLTILGSWRVFVNDLQIRNVNFDSRTGILSQSLSRLYVIDERACYILNVKGSLTV